MLFTVYVHINIYLYIYKYIHNAQIRCHFLAMAPSEHIQLMHVMTCFYDLVHNGFPSFGFRFCCTSWSFMRFPALRHRLWKAHLPRRQRPRKPSTCRQNLSKAGARQPWRPHSHSPNHSLNRSPSSPNRCPAHKVPQHMPQNHKDWNILELGCFSCHRCLNMVCIDVHWHGVDSGTSSCPGFGPRTEEYLI